LAAIVALMALMTMGTTTWGQRGIGDNDGVTRQAIETQQTSIQGKIKEIVIEKCENTTGPFDIGMHLLLTTDETKQYNVHLGPAVIVRDLIDQLEVGKSVTVKAYRTEKMPKENFVAIVLKYDGKTVRLRDENLRPVWAGGQGRSWGRYQARSELPRWRPWITAEATERDLDGAWAEVTAGAGATPQATAGAAEAEDKGAARDTDTGRECVHGIGVPRPCVLSTTWRR